MGGKALCCIIQNYAIIDILLYHFYCLKSERIELDSKEAAKVTNFILKLCGRFLNIKVQIGFERILNFL